MPAASAPPFGLAVNQAFWEKSFSSRRAAAKNSEEWRAIRLRIVRRYRNRPEGGMPATEYYAGACTVESNLCLARRSRGTRALLPEVYAVPSLFAGRSGRVNRVSGLLWYITTT